MYYALTAYGYTGGEDICNNTSDEILLFYPTLLGCHFSNVNIIFQAEFEPVGNEIAGETLLYTKSVQ